VATTSDQRLLPHDAAAHPRRLARRLIAGTALFTGLAFAGGIVVNGGGGNGGDAAAAAAFVPPTDDAAPRVIRAHAALRRRLGSGNAVTFAFGGDVHFEGSIRAQLDASPARLLEEMEPVLSRADIAIVNLETAVTEGGEAAVKEYVFRAPATAFEALRSAGVDVATIANNHGMDYGTTGLVDTLAASRGTGVSLVGGGANTRDAYAPLRFSVKGQRIAIIAATQVLDSELAAAWTAAPNRPGLASALDEPRLVRAVREARATSDTVVVYLHWGEELTACPTESQTSLAATVVRAGADVVVGSHAHVALGAGRLGRAFVDYGLGNFVFYTDGGTTAQTGVLEVTATGRRIDRYGWVPAEISHGIPSPLTGDAAADAVAGWRALADCTNLRP
jgi:poly-gamma-glutamate capsule biosynthesis protein CapA/YwtB (metallophosphatase superfamily)